MNVLEFIEKNGGVLRLQDVISVFSDDSKTESNKFGKNLYFDMETSGTSEPKRCSTTPKNINAEELFRRKT